MIPKSRANPKLSDYVLRDRPTPSRRPNLRLSNPQLKGGGCLVPLIVFVLLVLATITWSTGAVDAQVPQPKRYLVADYSSNLYAHIVVYWFEPDDRTECYTYDVAQMGIGSSSWGGGGISCLRKEK